MTTKKDAAQDLTCRGTPRKQRVSVAYDPSFCDLVIELGKKGKTFTQMCAAIGCTMRAFKNWETGEPGHPGSNKPEFTEAMALARIYAQAWWEDDMQAALSISDGKMASSKAAIYRITMQARFPHDYRETARVEHTGAGGGPIVTADTARSELRELLKDPTVQAALGVNFSLPEPERRH